jgi:hypothetical protein
VLKSEKSDGFCTSYFALSLPIIVCKFNILMQKTLLLLAQMFAFDTQGEGGA